MIKFILKSIIPLFIAAMLYAIIYKIDYIMIFAMYMLIFVPIWLVVSNIKFILKLKWIEVVVICLYFSLIITIYSALSLEIGALLRNTRVVSLWTFIDAFKAIFIISLPSNMVMTVVVVIIKIIEKIWKYRK